jgi:membrane protein implicated in regulation of membrane protease activity
MSTVQTLASPRRARLPIGAAVIGSLVGLALLSGGLFLGWLAFATPLVSALAPASIRPSAPQMALGGLVWGIALVAPASFALVGAWRLSRVIRAITARPAVRVLTQASAQLGDEYVAASDIRLPEGRLIRNLVLGPFGLAVINELPPPRFLRRTGASWEMRGPDGRWVHLENPLERASRDAERVRSWFSASDRDYVLKVFAALVTSDASITRTATCTVVAPDQVPGWLASLPPSRALNPDRREDLVDQIRALL